MMRKHYLGAPFQANLVFDLDMDTPRSLERALKQHLEATIITHTPVSARHGLARYEFDINHYCT